jgi:formylglycine-generating enzyme required for sulfatase activity
MKRTRLVVFVCFALAAVVLSAQERFALVIGNGAYGKITALKNPVNDATDMAAALKGMGFQVDLLTDASLDAMENAVVALGQKLGANAGSYGFFFYAGHGVQSNGINYLIPADADIKSEAFLKNRSLAAQEVLDTLQQAGNGLNVVVLDACRDNPFGWGRSGTRGMGAVSSQPPGSIIAYATSAGSVAQDGTGRNGLFTSQLLKNLKTPGLEISDVFKRTGADVMAASGNKQVPAVYSQFFKTAYLAGAGKPTPAAPSPQPSPESDWGEVTVTPGSLNLTVATAGTVTFNGKTKQLPAGASVSLNNIAPGDYPVRVAYADGQSESRTVRIEAGKAAAVAFSYQPASTGEIVVVNAAKASLKVGGKGYSLPEAGRWSIKDQAAGSQTVTLSYDDGKSESQTVTVPAGGSVEASFKHQPGAVAPAPAGGNAGTQVAGQNFTNSLGATMVWVPGGSFTMGDTAGGGDKDEIKHQVSLSGFYMGQTEVTQAQWQKVMGSNPSNFIGGSDAPNRPVEQVSWYDAVEFCNKLSLQEGKSPVYTINGNNVTLNQGASGYRLPTEAEWEYAAKGGASTPVQTVKYAGSANLEEIAWTSSNSGNTTHPVAQKKANGLGLYDMSGNVWEWCWDWKGDYSTSAQTDPAGPASGTYRVIRGGNWYSSAGYARLSDRYSYTPDYRNYDIGFRVVLPAVQK